MKKDLTKKTKAKKTKNKRNSKRQKGGIHIMDPYEDDTEGAFTFFYKNSRIELLYDTSAFGVVYKLTLKDGMESPYISLRSNTFYEPVTTIIFKVQIIKDLGDEIPYYSQTQKKTKYTIKSDEFDNELETQIDIFRRSNDNLEAICPSIVHAKKYRIDLNRNDDILFKNIDTNMDPKAFDSLNRLRHCLYNLEDSWRQSRNESDELRNSLGLPEASLGRRSQSGSDTYYGIIAMEFACNGYNVSKEINKIKTMNDETSKKKSFENLYLLTLYEHYRLFQLGYFHGDFHLNNALLCKNYPYFRETNFQARVILIDFGATFKVPESFRLFGTTCTLSEFIDILLNNTSPTWLKNGFNNLTWKSFQWVKEMNNYKHANKTNFFEMLENNLITSHIQTRGGQIPAMQASPDTLSIFHDAKSKEYYTDDKAEVVTKTHTKKVFSKEEIKKLLDEEYKLHERILANVRKQTME